MACRMGLPDHGECLESAEEIRRSAKGAIPLDRVSPHKSAKRKPATNACIGMPQEGFFSSSWIGFCNEREEGSFRHHGFDCALYGKRALFVIMNWITHCTGRGLS